MDEFLNSSKIFVSLPQNLPYDLDSVAIPKMALKPKTTNEIQNLMALNGQMAGFNILSSNLLTNPFSFWL